MPASLAGVRCDCLPCARITCFFADKTTFLGSLCAIFPYKYARQFSTDTSLQSSPRSTNLTIFTATISHTGGKTLTIQTPTSLQFASSTLSATRRRPLPWAALDHATNTTNYHISPGMSQLSVMLNQHQTTAIQQRTRRGRGKGDPGT